VEGVAADDRVDAAAIDDAVLSEGALRAVWAQALCRTVAQDDERWLADVHTVPRLADRRAIARELWKTVCSECPVWGKCLRWAVENDEIGIWAGTVKEDRAKMGRTAGGNMTTNAADSATYSATYSADEDA
jgi:hypothetical protein